MNNNRATLVLMEQMIMIAVFALAAAICLQAFVKSDSLSQADANRDHAVLLVQSAAETIRTFGLNSNTNSALTAAADALGGTYEQGRLYVYYDESWNQTTADSPSCTYNLVAMGEEASVSGLRTASVWVELSGTTEGTPLFSLQIAWQGVTS